MTSKNLLCSTTPFGTKAMRNFANIVEKKILRSLKQKIGQVGNGCERGVPYLQTYSEGNQRIESASCFPESEPLFLRMIRFWMLISNRIYDYNKKNFCVVTGLGWFALSRLIALIEIPYPCSAIFRTTYVVNQINDGK